MIPIWKSFDVIISHDEMYNAFPETEALLQSLTNFIQMVHEN